jgi:hypothetical protein
MGMWKVFVSSPLQLSGEVHEIEAPHALDAINQIKSQFTHYDCRRVDSVYDEDNRLHYNLRDGFTRHAKEK